MVYKQYTLSGSKGVPFGWRCPECGKLSLDVYKVSAASTYDDRGFRVKLDERRAKADAALSGALDRNAKRAILDAENRRFDKMRFASKCADCGYEPAWSNIPKPPKVIATLRDICLAAAIILALIGAMSSSGNGVNLYRLAGIAAAAMLALMLAGFLIRRAAYARVRPDIERLDPKSLPHMAMTGPLLVRRLTEDGLMTRSEAETFGAPLGESVGWSGSDTLSRQYRREAEEDRKARRKKRIVAAALAVAVLALIGVGQMDRLKLSQWQDSMEAAQLFASNASAGSKYVVYEKRSTGGPQYKKKYLSSNQLASTPDEVGYIVVIEDSDEIVGTYGVFNKNAYRVHTWVRLYDCRTGRYIGNGIELLGGQPPKSIKSTQSSGRGSRPSAGEITGAIDQLIRQTAQSDDGTVAL